MLAVVTWKWGTLFGPEYVNRLRGALATHLRVPHQLWCVTDTAVGIHPDVRIVDMPHALNDTPRCRRRLRMFDRSFARQFGPRTLCMDLDMVIVDDITPLVQPPYRIVGWQVDHADVISGSFLLMNAGALDELWRLYIVAVQAGREEGFWRAIQARGIPSDQAALNWFIKQREIPTYRLKRDDGIVTYYGAGYERFEHLGVGPNRPELPAGARLVVLGSDDLPDLESGRYAWAREHWGPPLVREGVSA